MNKIITYKCRNCGGPLHWDAGKKKFFCDYCASAFTEEEVAAQMPLTAEVQPAEEPVEPAESAGTTESPPEGLDSEEQSGDGEEKRMEQAVLYTCPSCGAEIVTDETTAASFCYYCHNPVVLTGRLSGEYMPEQLIPFQIDRARALEIFRSWIGQKKYVPRDFYSDQQIEHLSGVYFPYWMYGCTLQGKIRAEGTKLRTWVLGDWQYTEHKIYEVSREGRMGVQDLARLALTKANRVLTEGILPFEYQALTPFHMSYLQGFLAERRDVNRQSLEQEVLAEVDDLAKERLQAELSGYSAVQIRELQTIHSQERWQYVLLPVWTMTYRAPHDSRLYYFSVNGQTGKVCGALPVDWKALIRLFFIIFVSVLLVLLLFWWFL